MGSLHEVLAGAAIDRGENTDVATLHNHQDHVNGLISPDGSEDLVLRRDGCAGPLPGTRV
ncbi:hypothetical protein GCM10009680_72280 [Streptomyces yatensis]|uniref:Uncharacterized protein n=1 Tax=Streptomyces yatensis TaxID=155177 RepID=A0ABP4VC51_9ACTN